MINKRKRLKKPSKITFEEWYSTVPQDRNDTTSYHLRRAYALAPLEDLEAWRTASKEDLLNGKFHLNSVYFNPETKEYEFMKSKDHPTFQKELDWYYSKDGKNFRQHYTIDSTDKYWKYIPIESHKSGGRIKLKEYNIGGTNEFSPEIIQERIKNIDFKENPFIKEEEPDFTGIKTTEDRAYNPDYIAYINKALIKKGYDNRKRAIILGNIIEESGGDPFSVNDTNEFRGLLQWSDERFPGYKTKDPYKEIDRQLNYLYNTIDNLTDQKSWTHGGDGSGYMKARHAHNMFNLPLAPIEQQHRAFSFGYVIPRDKGESFKNRYKVVNQVFDRLINYGR